MARTNMNKNYTVGNCVFKRQDEKTWVAEDANKNLLAQFWTGAKARSFLEKFTAEGITEEQKTALIQAATSEFDQTKATKEAEVEKKKKALEAKGTKAASTEKVENVEDGTNILAMEEGTSDAELLAGATEEQTISESDAGSIDEVLETATGTED